MFAPVLMLHILGAVVMAGVALYTLISIKQNNLFHIKRAVLLLAWSLGFELASGSLLALLSTSGVSFANFCQNVAFYLVASGSIFLIAYVRARTAFPKAPVFVPIFPSLLFAGATALSLL